MEARKFGWSHADTLDTYDSPQETLPVVGEPLQRDVVAGTIPGEARRERAIVLRHPDGGVHVEFGVRPRQHAGGLLRIEQPEAHEEPEQQRGVLRKSGR